MHIFQVSVRGKTVNVVLTSQSWGWLAQVGDNMYRLCLLEGDGSRMLHVEVDGEPIDIDLDVGGVAADEPRQMARLLQDLLMRRAGLPGAPAKTKKTKRTHGDALLSPMTGIVLEVQVRPGERVSKGDRIAVVEAMKMENRVLANSSGVVREVCVAPGATVRKGDVIAVVTSILHDDVESGVDDNVER